MMRAMASSRLAWVTYDFGNTAIEFVVALYLGPWLLLDRHLSPRTYGVLFALVSWGIVGTAPYVGVAIDRWGRAGQVFRGATLASAVLLGCLSAFPEEPAWNATLLLTAGIGLYLFAVAAIVYNSAMRRATGSDGSVLYTSAVGTAFSYCGGVIGIALIAAIAGGGRAFVVGARRYAFLWGAVFFFVSAIPALLSRQLWRAPEGGAHMISRGAPWRMVLGGVALRRLSIGYVLSNMCIVGMLLYVPMYLRERGYSSNEVVLWFIWGAVCAGVGAVSAFVWAKYPGEKSLLWGAIGACAVGAALFGISGRGWAVAATIGLESAAAGAFLAGIRAAFAKTLPPAEQASGFGVVGSLQRVSGGLGALFVPLLMRNGAEFGIWPVLGCAACGTAGAIWLAAAGRDDRVG